MTKVLVTGSAGFVGSHLVDHILAVTDWEVIGLDSFRHRGDAERVRQLGGRYRVYSSDLSAPISPRTMNKIGHPDYVINMASESHVDRSITDPVAFVNNNVNLALNVFEACRYWQPDHVIQISTDEVYGPALEGTKHKEGSEILPSNPYAASKACQEAIATSYWRTYGLPITITNCFAMDMRVLTKQGPKSWDQVTTEDQVWTLDADENLVLTPVIEKVRMPGPETMVRFNTPKVSQLVTPNHRMMIRRPTGSPRRWGPIEECLAEDLVEKPNRFRVPTTGIWSGVDLGEDFIVEGASPAAMMTIYGWFVSEGYLSEEYAVCFGAGTPEQQEELMELLSVIGNPYVNGRSVRVHNKDLYEICKQFGKYAENKVVPEFIKKTSSQLLSYFLNAAIDGDGSRYRTNKVWATVYYTKSEKLAFDMVEVGMKCGHSCRVSERTTWNPSKTKTGDSFIVRFRESRADLEKQNVTTESYKEDVWCIKTATGRVFVEHNGIISLSGQTMNMIGEYQDAEKYIPKAISKIMQGEILTVHGNTNYIGKRHYLHARNHADALVFLLENTNAAQYHDEIQALQRPSRYNIVGDVEMDNLQLALAIAEICCKPLIYELVDFHAMTTRPGHDRRYALDGSKIAAIGWKAPVEFYQSLKKTVEWYLDNPTWLE